MAEFEGAPCSSEEKGRIYYRESTNDELLLRASLDIQKKIDPHFYTI